MTKVQETGHESMVELTKSMRASCQSQKFRKRAHENIILFEITKSILALILEAPPANFPGALFDLLQRARFARTPTPPPVLPW